MPIVEESYIGKGVVYIKNRASGGYRFLANVESLTNSFDTEEKNIPNNTRAGGGYWDVLSRIKGAKASTKMFDLSAANLALATNGSTSAVVAGAIVAEAVTATALGEIVPTANIIDTSIAPLVKNTGGTTTYVLNTDYTVSAAGITPAIGGTMTPATGFTVGYTKKAGNVIEMLTSSAAEYTIMIDGLNEANSGSPVRITLFRCKPSATNEISYIGDDFARLQVDFQMLADTSIVTTGKSQYAKIEMAT